VIPQQRSETGRSIMLFSLRRASVSAAPQVLSTSSSAIRFTWLILILPITLYLAACSSVSNPNASTAQNTQAGAAIQISPLSADVQSAGSLQLTATLTGTNRTAVTWSTTVGSISGSGLFKAPVVTSATQVIVTAASQSALSPNSASSGSSSSSGSISGSATLTVLPPGSSAALSISSASLPLGTVGLAYSASVTATGGSEPYTWSAISGTLPAGLTLEPSSGTVTGTPALPGTYTFQLQVADSLAHTATSSSNVVVTNQGSSTFDGPAELPRVYLKTAMSDTPTPGVITLVGPGGDFQSALNNASCGDTIQLQSGTTFSGLFKVPPKACDSQHWIIVRSSAPDSSLPAENVRVSPCYAGVSSLPGRPALNCQSTTNVLAKILYTQTAGSGPIQFESGANHYRFIGVEITRSTGTGYVGALASAPGGVSADSIIFDRSWLHGTSQDETGEGVALAGITNTSVINSYLGDFHCTSKVGSCTDSHAISGGSGSGAAGPYQIVNNFLEAAGENIIFGGGAATVSPGDIQISQNHFFKPMTWMAGQAGFVGGSGGNPFVVKNHLELKNAQRVLAEDNIFENTWGGFSQTGFSILLTPKDQYDSTTQTNICPLCQVTDVTIRYSTISHVGAGIQIANVLSDGGGVASAGERYSVHDVVIDDISASKYAGGGGFLEVGNGWSTNVLNSVTVNHVTAFPDPVAHMLNVYNDTTNPTMWGFNFTNNIVNSTKYPVWNGSGHSISCSYHDVPLTSLATCFTSYSFVDNVIAAAPSGYPPSSWPAGNFFPATDSAIQFVNYNNGNGGDYQLSQSSPYKGTASDGKDPGADIVAVQAAIAEVY
jgi:Putative Ig domain